ncbi:MAG: zinc ribbon domain-containing protein [Firmicutes bacterium]|nr:zinc ribbon domain-containing protein [Bacillota bacterium]
MPNYDLRCLICHQEFNIDATVTKRQTGQIPCPSCGGYELAPVFKSTHFTIKNSADTVCPNSHICGPSCHHTH